MLKEFQDSQGEAWRVWDVNPVLHARAGSRKLASKAPDAWLCFESAHQRRRLTPIPSAWEFAGVQELETLMNAAAVVPQRRGEARTPPASPKP